LSADSLKVAVNERFSDWQHALADGDTVVFVPPVAGG
jgi:molybdopterin converting factor small subunit